jgi:gamma-glutamyltranspeptidase / glutathione hydrolase
MTTMPWTTVRAPGAMVASADALATQAGLRVAALGGHAVDIAIAANAVLAVTSPHLCGLGGDLFALVHDAGELHALDAAGRAGSGVDPSRLRAEGLTEMPFRLDASAVTVPGCVDGWVALHDRFGRLPLDTVFESAISLAVNGFPASPLLVASIQLLDARGRETLTELVVQARQPGDRVRRPGVAAALRAVAAGGREAFYLGEFGDGLRRLGAGVFSVEDLATLQASYVRPLITTVFGQRVATIAAPSQGYLTLAAAAIAEGHGLPDDPSSADWAHVLVESMVAAGHDRAARLYDGADLESTLVDIALRRIDPDRAARLHHPVADGDTTYLCVVDVDGNGVSLIQSNASGFGSWLVEPATGINLHNRGIGFSLVEGHPGELAPGRRPPHTLSPALVTTSDQRLVAVLGTMGGDAQPQIVVQLLTRLLHHRQSPARAIAAGRWALRGPQTGFDTWTSGRVPVVTIEDHAPTSWRELPSRGHRVQVTPSWDSSFGHAHMILLDDDGMRLGAADPRSRIGSCAGTA